MARTKTRLRFQVAIAQLPPLPLAIVHFKQARYPKGHPKGGQFKPAKGDAATTDDSKPGILSRGKAAIASKLAAIAERLGFMKPAPAEPDPEGVKLPVGFKRAQGRGRSLPPTHPDSTEQVEREIAYRDGGILSTEYGLSFKGGRLEASSDVYVDTEDDDSVYSLFSVLERVRPDSLRSVKKFQKEGGRVHSYFFQVNGKFSQSEFSSSEISAEVIKTIKNDYRRMIHGVQEGELITVIPFNGDGRGKGREAAYRKMGFSKKSKDGQQYAMRWGDQLIPVEPK